MFVCHLKKLSANPTLFTLLHAGTACPMVHRSTNRHCDNSRTFFGLGSAFAAPRESTGASIKYRDRKLHGGNAYEL
jgi:hypothetical protein